MSDKLELIVYLDDDEKKVTANVRIIELNNSFVSFETFVGNIITIPMRRVLKIKERVVG